MSVASSDTNSIYHSYSERTLALIKPEAYEDAEDIENHIRGQGFNILAKRQVRLTPEQAAELYRGHYGRLHFPHLVAHISSGPVVALVLAAKNCIAKWRTLMGPARVQEAQAYWPDSIRACYGRRTKYGDYFNAVHGSENHAEAIREIKFFFPQKFVRDVLDLAEGNERVIMYGDLNGWVGTKRDSYEAVLGPYGDKRVNEAVIVGPILRKWQINDYIQKHITPTLLPGLSQLARERPAEPLLWLAEYLQQHNPNKPEVEPHPTEKREDQRCYTPELSEESL